LEIFVPRDPALLPTTIRCHILKIVEEKALGTRLAPPGAWLVLGLCLACAWLVLGLCLACAWLVLGLCLACAWPGAGGMVDSCGIQVGWISVNSATTTSDFNGFLKAVNVWIERPHVVNRRLMGAVIVQRTSVEYLTRKDLERSVKLLCDDQGKYLFQGNGNKERKTTKHDDIYVITKSDAEGNESRGKENHSGARVCEEDRNTVIVRKLLPKQIDRKDAIFELVILGKCI